MSTLTSIRQRNPMWTLVVASVAVLMPLLDALVVATALPALRDSLQASLSDLEWTVNAYNLSFACLLLTGAALGDRFGRRRMLCVGLAVFTVASVAAALAPTIDALIAARAAQGAGGAMVMPLTLTLISNAFPAERRGWAIGVWGGFAGLSGAVGPFVGGVIVQSIDWQWIFWVNVPIGLVLIPMAIFGVTESYGGRPRLDVVGLVLAGAGLCAITWGLVRTSAVGWDSTEVVATLIGGVAATGLFLRWEQRTPHPMLSLAMFRSPRFAAANGASFSLYAAIFGALFLMAQYFQTARGLSPLQTGAQLLMWSAPGLVVAPIAGRLGDRYGNRPFLVTGLLMQALGLAGVAVLARYDAGFAALSVALLVAGSGAAMVFPTVANEAVAAVPAADIGIASGTNSALRELGGVFGVAILALVFTRPNAYTDHTAFVTGFSTALWVGAAMSALGMLAAKSASRSPSAD